MAQEKLFATMDAGEMRENIVAEMIALHNADNWNSHTAIPVLRKVGILNSELSSQAFTNDIDLFNQLVEEANLAIANLSATKPVTVKIEVKVETIRERTVEVPSELTLNTFEDWVKGEMGELEFSTNPEEIESTEFIAGYYETSDGRSRTWD